MDISTTVATLKAVAGVMRDANRLDLTAQMIELQQALLELIGHQSTLASENADLRGKIHELVTLIRQREEFYFERNAYWRGEAEQLDGPFCSRCFDVTGKAVRMIENTRGVGHCGECKANARLTGPAQPRTTSVRRVLSPGWVNSWK